MGPSLAKGRRYYMPSVTKVIGTKSLKNFLKMYCM